MRLLGTITLLILLTACALQADAPAAPTNLTRALAFVPEGTSQVFFTDWSLIKAYKGMKDLSSQSGLEQRSSLIVSLGQDQAAFSTYGVAHVFEHAKVWGWDSSDLDWEVSAVGGQPVYLLKFRDTFDFAPVLAHFDERGFTQSDYKGVRVHSHPMQVGMDWLRATEFAILNTALLPDQKIFLMASTPDAVHNLIDTYKRDAKPLGDRAAIQSIANRLGAIASAYVDPSASDCHAKQGAISPDVLRKWMEENWKKALAVHVYDALAIGYRYENDKPLGLVVMHYNNSSDALADIESRRLLAQGPSLITTNKTIPEVLFSVDTIAAQDGDLIMRVKPVGDRPSVLISAVARRDMVWAGCPSAQ